MGDFKTAAIDYTDEQDKAINSMGDWSYKSSPFYTLEGAAGTGKTTVLNEFIRNNKFNVNSIVVTAPTHKAVRIVSQMTGVKGVTVQKLLGLRPNVILEDFDINNPRFDPRARKAIMDYKLVIIDEASMVNKDLYNLIIREAKEFGVKVLFVGDSLQLPPVNEGLSLCFTQPQNKFSLKTIMRQSEGNPLLELLNIVRADVKSNGSKFIKHLYSNPVSFNEDGSGYVVADKEHFRNYITNAFGSDAFSNNINYAKYCAYTNANVLAWNAFIRSTIFGETSSDIIIKDDLIVSYSTILDEFLAPIIVNSEDYILDDIQAYKNQSNIDGFVVRFRKVFGGDYTPYMFIVDTAKDGNVKKFLRITNNLLREAKIAPASQKRSKWENFYSFKNNNLLIRSLYDDRDRLIVKKDIDYGYCLTVHKTQGSTYNHSFVNIRNMIYNKYGRPFSDITLRNKLIYVALSRASDTATLLL